MDTAQQQLAVFRHQWKRRHNNPQAAAAAALLLGAAVGLLVRAPNDDTVHSTFFFAQCAHWIGQ